MNVYTVLSYQKGIAMSKIAFILMPNYRNEEFLVPYEMLIKAEHTVDVVGMVPGVMRAAEGNEHHPNLLLSHLSNESSDHYDALIIPGGPGAKEHLWDNQVLKKLINDFHTNKKIVAGICYGVIPLVQSGILFHKHSTVYPSDEAKTILQEYGVKFSKDKCVTLSPEKIITAQDPSAALDFAKAILTLLP